VAAPNIRDEAMANSSDGSSLWAPGVEQRKSGNALMSEVYIELRQEIELLAKAKPVESNVPVKFPDPVCLSQIERRVLVKSIFSFVEAMSYSMKVFALDSSDVSRLTQEEQLLAVEQEYYLDSSGHAKIRRAKLQTLGNVRFAFAILAKAALADFSLDVSNESWQILQRALKVRDRLMHPKGPDDLSVSDDEIRDALRAFIWFEHQITLILAATINSLEKQIAEAES
jgi:hypothetical protein